jgi:hypothetical protein
MFIINFTPVIYLAVGLALGYVAGRVRGATRRRKP